MKKATLFVLLGLFFLPSIASAAWWNPFTWGRAAVATANEVDASSTASTTVDTSLLPTTDDLYKRIAELELKLDNARTELKKAEAPSPVAKAVTVAAPASTGSLSDSAIISKVKPAIVLVETASSSAAGVIVDAQGHILTNAHAVWNKNGAGNVIGAFPDATVTLSAGTKKKAVLVGIDEASDLAVLQFTDKQSSASITLNYDSGLSIGDKAYVFGFPSALSNGGSSFVTGTIAQKSSAAVQVTTDTKTFDNGGAMVTSKGSFIGVPVAPTCKVLEEMRNCLKYTVTAPVNRTTVGKILLGMKLYKNKVTDTPEEVLIGGYLNGLYNSINQSDALEYAIDNVTGNNSFDYFNTKLVDDVDHKVAKIYLIKLKSGAQNIYLAFDFLKSAAYALHVSLINDSASTLKLDSYQQKIVQGVQTANDARLKDYQNKVEFWSKKKNEYDAYLLKIPDATNDYLMAEGVAVESAAEYLRKERQSIIDSLSGETLNIF